MLLVPIENVKVFLEKNETDTTHDSLIGMIVEYVSDRIQAYLNRDLSKEYRTINFNAKKSKFFLPAFPIDTDASITVTLDTILQEKNEDYYVWNDSGLVEFSFNPVYLEPKQIEITWLGGYETSTVSVAGVSKVILEDIPDSIKFATLIQSSFVYRNRLNTGATSVTLPGGSVTGIFFGDLLPEVKSILNMYRKTSGEY